MQGRDTGLVIGLVVVAVLLFGLLGGGTMMGPGMMGWYGGYNSWWGFGAMILFWAAILVGGGLLVAALLRRERTPNTGFGPAGSRALEILRERYARGEITKEQFDQMRRDLGDDR